MNVKCGLCEYLCKEDNNKFVYDHIDQIIYSFFVDILNKYFCTYLYGPYLIFFVVNPINGIIYANSGVHRFERISVIVYIS